MKGYYLSTSCLRCGSPVEPVNDGRTLGTETLAVCRCTSCRWEWQVVGYMRPMKGTLT